MVPSPGDTQMFSPASNHSFQSSQNPSPSPASLFSSTQAYLAPSPTNFTAASTDSSATSQSVSMIPNVVTCFGNLPDLGTQASTVTNFRHVLNKPRQMGNSISLTSSRSMLGNILSLAGGEPGMQVKKEPHDALKTSSSHQ